MGIAGRGFSLIDTATRCPPIVPKVGEYFVGHPDLYPCDLGFRVGRPVFAFCAAFSGMVVSQISAIGFTENKSQSQDTAKDRAKILV